jgi:hypothetical protein
MALINGRGQIGTCLSRYKSKTRNYDIYHTWNFLDKSYKTQKEEFKKLKNFLDSHDGKKKIVFISTKIKSKSYYYKFKIKAEKLIKKNSSNNLIIRLPSLIGKGIFDKLAKQLVKPFGIIEFVSIEEACNFIVKSLKKEGTLICEGWKVSAKNILEIMLLTKNCGS